MTPYETFHYIFIKEIVFENIICKMAAILSQPQCVNSILAKWQSIVTACCTRHDGTVVMSYVMLRSNHFIRFWLRTKLNFGRILNSNGKVNRTMGPSIILIHGKKYQQCLIITAEHNVHYRKVSNIRCTLVGNNTVDHSDVVGASPVGAAPTTSSFST